MKAVVRIALAAALVAVPASQAMAGWRLISAKQTVTVAKSKLAVTPGEDWNRGTHRASAKGETNWMAQHVEQNKEVLNTSTEWREGIVRKKTEGEENLFSFT